MREGKRRGGMAIFLAAALAAAGGCANVVYRGPVRKIGQETRERRVRSETRDLDLAYRPGALRDAVEVRPVSARDVEVETRTLHREYGYFIPFNPLAKVTEYAALPVYIGIGFVLVYKYWTFDDLDGGIGRGLPASAPSDVPPGLDPYCLRLAEDVDDAARDPAALLLEGSDLNALWVWWELLGEVTNPFVNARFPSLFRVRFGPVGSVIETPWRTETRRETDPLADVVPEVLVNGRSLKPERAGPGVFVVSLADRGPGPFDLVAAVPDGKGGRVERRLTVGAEEVEAIREAQSLREILEQNTGDHEVRCRLAALHLRFGGVRDALSILLDGLEGRKTPRRVLAALREAYRRGARKAWKEGDAATAMRVDALGDFHAEVLGGAPSQWPERALPSGRLLVEGLGSPSFKVRARSAVLTATREDLAPFRKTATLLALLRNERHPVARWAVLWALGRCGTEDAAGAVEAVAAEEGDPFLEAMAAHAARAVRERAG